MHRGHWARSLCACRCRRRLQLRWAASLGRCCRARRGRRRMRWRGRGCRAATRAASAATAEPQVCPRCWNVRMSARCCCSLDPSAVIVTAQGPLIAHRFCGSLVQTQCQCLRGRSVWRARWGPSQRSTLFDCASWGHWRCCHQAPDGRERAQRARGRRRRRRRCPWRTRPRSRSWRPWASRASARPPRSPSAAATCRPR